jgi:hypothetical protein
MTTHFNFFKKSLIVGLSLAAVVSSPSLMLAQDKAIIAPADFCKRFDEIETKITTDLNSKEKDILTARLASDTLLQTGWAKEDADQKDARAKEDIERSKQFDSLDATATTDEQKASVESFKKTVAEAISAERKTIDDAIAAYRSDFLKTTEVRKNLVDEILSSYKDSTLSAIEKAKAGCTAKKDPLKTRETFKDTLKNIDDKLQNDKTEVDKTEADFQNLGDTKEATLNLAEENFKTTIDKASSDLKNVTDTTAADIKK